MKKKTIYDMQRSYAKMLGKKHLIDSNTIYSRFMRLNIFIPSINHHFNKNSWIRTNNVLLSLVENNNETGLMNLINNDYTQIRI